MVSTWDSSVPMYSTRFLLWTCVLLLSSSGVYAGLTGLMCGADQSYPNYVPACEYAEGEVAWVDALVVTAFFPCGCLPGDYEIFYTALIYTKEGCLLDQGGLPFGDPRIDCKEVAKAGEDFGPIAVEHAGHFIASSLGFLDYIPIEIVDDCDAESDEVFSVLVRRQPFDFGSLPEGGNEVVIKDNDDNFYFEFEYYDVIEGIGNSIIFNFTVKRCGILAKKTIEYSTIDLTTDSPDDFSPKEKANIDFEEGSECETATIDIEHDREAKGPELFAIELFFPVDSGTRLCTGKIVYPGKAYVTIHGTETILFYIEHGDYSVIEPEKGEVKIFTFNIKRKGNLVGTSKLEYSIRDLSTTAGYDYNSPWTQSVSFEPGSDNAQVSITIKSDASTEQPETFELSLEVFADEGLVTNPAKAIVTIQDYSTTRSCVGFAIPEFSVLESDGSVGLTIWRSGNVKDAAVVDLTTEGIDARPQEDYSSLWHSPAYFGPEETETIATLTVLDDQRKEDTEYLKVYLQRSLEFPGNVDICTKDTQVLIQDDEVKFYLDWYFYKLKEGDTVEINIVRLGYLEKESTVRVEVIPGSATFGDYSVGDGDTSVQFAIGQKFHSLVISANADIDIEALEEFTVQIVSDFNNNDQIGIPNQAKIVIESDNLLCKPPCVNGECIGLDTCLCPPAFTGSLCETSLCNPPCINGECIGVNTCNCEVGFTGSLCESQLQMVPGSITIVERPPGTPAVFTEDLNNPNSALYKQMEADIKADLLELYSDMPEVLDVIILFFSPGSIMVTYEVVVETGSSTTEAELMQQVQESLSNDGVLIGSDLKLDPTDLQVQDTGKTTSDSPMSSSLISILLGGIALVICLLLFLLVSCVWIRRLRLRKTPVDMTPVQLPVQQPIQLSDFTFPQPELTLIPFEGINELSYGEGVSSLTS